MFVMSSFVLKQNEEFSRKEDFFQRLNFFVIITTSTTTTNYFKKRQKRFRKPWVPFLAIMQLLSFFPFVSEEPLYKFTYMSRPMHAPASWIRYCDTVLLMEFRVRRGINTVILTEFIVWRGIDMALLLEFRVWRRIDTVLLMEFRVRSIGPILRL